MRTVTLLGPQRLQPHLVHEVDQRGIDGPIAAVTAGWQEREAEDGELRSHLRRPVENLMLHQRSEEVFAEDPELFLAHRARQDRLRAMQRLYRYRLDFALEPARDLLGRDGDPEVLAPEQEAALSALRTLDAQHLARIRAVDRAFDEAWQPHERPAVARHREELREILAGVAALAIAGGHVAVLLNRLRLFGIPQLLRRNLPIFAWSAGAMVLAERIVLFHDDPPRGAGNAEVLETGLGLFRGLLPLPHARRRLHLDNRVRVALFARRFSPSLPVPLDQGATLHWNGRRWLPAAGSRCLGQDGTVHELTAA